jgi:hypothetical protein
MRWLSSWNRLGQSIRLTPLVWAALVLSGCDAKRPLRYEVTGTVLYQDQPLEEGIIEFEPQDGQGTKSGASILKGEYRIPKAKGLSPGRYKVTIIAGDGVPRSGHAEPSGRLPKGISPGKERIPPEYNVNSKVIKEITKDGPNRFDFPIS